MCSLCSSFTLTVYLHILIIKYWGKRNQQVLPPEILFCKICKPIMLKTNLPLNVFGQCRNHPIFIEKVTSNLLKALGIAQTFAQRY